MRFLIPKPIPTDAAAQPSLADFERALEALRAQAATARTAIATLIDRRRTALLDPLVDDGEIARIDADVLAARAMIDRAAERAPHFEERAAELRARAAAAAYAKQYFPHLARTKGFPK